MIPAAKTDTPKATRVRNHPKQKWDRDRHRALVLALSDEGLSTTGAAKRFHISAGAISSQLGTLKLKYHLIQRLARAGKTGDEIFALSPLYATPEAPAESGGDLARRADILSEIMAGIALRADNEAVLKVIMDRIHSLPVKGRGV